MYVSTYICTFIIDSSIRRRLFVTIAFHWHLTKVHRMLLFRAETASSDVFNSIACIRVKGGSRVHPQTGSDFRVQRSNRCPEGADPARTPLVNNAPGKVSTWKYLWKFLTSALIHTSCTKDLKSWKTDKRFNSKRSLWKTVHFSESSRECVSVEKRQLCRSFKHTRNVSNNTYTYIYIYIY